MANANEYQGRIAVVTGGSGGIGGAIAKRLAAEGAVVHILDVKPGSVDGRFHALDVGDEASVNHVFDAIGAEHGAIDYLICCAGIYRPQPFLELSLDAWRQTLDVNLTGMFLSCRARFEIHDAASVRPHRSLLFYGRAHRGQERRPLRRIQGRHLWA